MARTRKKQREWRVRFGVRMAIAVAITIALAIAIGVLAAELTHDDDADPIAVPECQDGPTVPGIDVSYHQETIDWKRVRWAGVRFAFVRISDGLTVRDPQFEANWAGAKASGILRGSYQFFRPDQDPIAQADIAIAALAKDRGEIAVAIDVEVDGGVRPKQLAAKIQLWVDRVRDKLGVEPLVYTSPDLWRDDVGGANIPQPLWLAHYTTSCPTIPAPWTRWTFWQHSQTGRVKGIHGNVDLDVFAGTFDDLRALTIARR